MLVLLLPKLYPWNGAVVVARGSVPFLWCQSEIRSFAFSHCFLNMGSTTDSIANTPVALMFATIRLSLLPDLYDDAVLRAATATYFIFAIPSI